MKTPPPFSRAEAARLVDEIIVPALRKAQYGEGDVEVPRWYFLAKDIRLTLARRKAAEQGSKRLAARFKKHEARTFAALLKAAEENKLACVGKALKAIGEGDHKERKEQVLVLHGYAYALDAGRWPTVREVLEIMKRIVQEQEFFPKPDKPPTIPAPEILRFMLNNFGLPYAREKGGRPRKTENP